MQYSAIYVLLENNNIYWVNQKDHLIVLAPERICASVIIPTITNILNLSRSSGHFHLVFKQSVVSPFP